MVGGDCEMIEKCRHYEKYNKYCDVKGLPCISIDNCYYKQLQALKAENEELKKEKQEWHGITKELHYKTLKENTQLKAKCDKYKEALEEISKPCGRDCEGVFDCIDCVKSNEELAKKALEQEEVN